MLDYNFRRKFCRITSGEMNYANSTLLRGFRVTLVFTSFVISNITRGKQVLKDFNASFRRSTMSLITPRFSMTVQSVASSSFLLNREMAHVSMS